jgi:hypothetical protein
MKVDITADGVLQIQSQSATEDYALKKWKEDIKNGELPNNLKVFMVPKPVRHYR